MLHKKRAFQVFDVATAEELAEKLTEHTWCGCNAFRFAEILFLNDSTSADGAQEFAIVKNGQQIESITFGWCSQEKALKYINDLTSGTLRTEMGSVTNKIETSKDHGTCYLCA